jgi:hypothetical protein
MIQVQVGRPIPLTLQVFDGREDLKVSVIIMDRFGKEFFRQPMPHIKNGFYASFEIEMPDQEVLIAQYLTSAPEDYEMVQDVFIGVPAPVQPEKIMVGEVVETSRMTDIILGEVVDEKEI